MQVLRPQPQPNCTAPQPCTPRVFVPGFNHTNRHTAYREVGYKHDGSLRVSEAFGLVSEARVFRAMYLLNTTTIALKYFESHTVAPPYAVLSHRWGKEEIKHEDLIEIARSASDIAIVNGDSYQKLRGACSQAQKDGFEYLWIDTCCIDKTSSAELSEAINSMFRWYQHANICYAHLRDVCYDDRHDKTAPHLSELLSIKEQIARSEWFTRGWTLQELIAPPEVIFYDRDWRETHRKSSSADFLADITGIDEDVLTGKVDFRDLSVAVRMSWAANRVTTRIEDRAYSLLGLFDVSMPAIYGAGERAFTMLQEQILQRTDDHSILAWGMTHETRHENGAYSSSVLAKSPQSFAASGNVMAFGPLTRVMETSFLINGSGIHISLPLRKIGFGVSYVLLNCHTKDEPLKQLALPLNENVAFKHSGTFNRRLLDLAHIPYQHRKQFRQRAITLTIQPTDFSSTSYLPRLRLWIRSLPSNSQGFLLVQAYPPDAWDANTRLMSIGGYHPDWRAALRFKVYKQGEMIILFHHAPWPAITAMKIDPKNASALSELCNPENLTIDELRQSHDRFVAVRLRLRMKYILGFNTCVVDIMTLPMQVTRYLDTIRSGVGRYRDRWRHPAAQPLQLSQ